MAAQEKDPRSMLHLVKRLIALRKDPDLLYGAYRTYRAREGVYAYLRGEGWLVALNLTEKEKALELPRGGGWSFPPTWTGRKGWGRGSSCGPTRAWRCG